MHALRVHLLAFVLLAAPTTAHAWQTHVGGGVGSQGNDGKANAVAFDAVGNVVAGGRTRWSGDHGAATVAKVSPAGELVWRTFVDPVGSNTQFVATDPHGDVIAAGLAGGTDESYLGYFSVAKLDGATGALVWRHTLPESVAGRALVDATGDVVLSASVPVWDDDQTIERTRTDCEKLAGSDGTPRWRREDCDADAFAIDAAGDVWALGPRWPASSHAIVKLAGATGADLQRTPVQLQLGLSVTLRRLAVLDPVGNVVVGDGDVIAKIDATTGVVLWRHVIPGFAGTLGGMRDFTTNAAGDVLVVGSTPFVYGLGTDFTVLKLAGADGSERWRRITNGNDSRPGGAREVAMAVEIDRRGDVVVAGSLERGEQHASVVTKLTGKTGVRRWARRLRGKGGGLVALAIGPHGIAVAGTHYQPGSEAYVDNGVPFVVARVAGRAPVASRRVRVYE